MRLKGKVAIVTGAGSGIGQGIAELFAKEGAAVIVADINLANAEKTVQKIVNNKAVAIAVKTDVAHEDDVQNLIRKSVDTYGRIDILVNNAATWFQSSFLDTKAEQWDRTFNVNVKGVVFCSQQVVQQIIKQKSSGRIINIASISAQLALPDTAAYSASKGAVAQLSRNMAYELGKYNITVNSISPGTTETPMITQVLNDPEARKANLDRTVLKRFAKPIDIAHAALFLASDEARHITGINLIVDGGHMISGT